MHRRSFLQTAAAIALTPAAGITMTSTAFAATKPKADPMLDEWTGNYGGFPRFDQVKADRFKPAVLKSMDMNRVEIAAIAGSKDAATFDNTIVALEDSGRP